MNISMRRVLFVTAFIIATMAGAAQALDFSADMVSTAGGQRMSGKIYVTKDKVRMDMAGTTTITRMDRNVAWVLMPQQGMYMEQAVEPERLAGTAEKMPGEIERVFLGDERVDGRPAKKYRIVYKSAMGRASVVQWVDNASGIPVKTESEDGSWTMEYKNLKLGVPDDSLFEIPSGYKKFAMPSMEDIMRAARQNQ